MNTLSFILLSKVGLPVGGFAPLIVAILVIYWVYRKDNPSSSYTRTGVDANQERIHALRTESVKQEIESSRANAAANGAYVLHSHGREMDFSGQDLHGACFAGKDLSFAKFDNANLTKADFSYADLAHASFKGANLERADLYSANFKETDFRGANMFGCNYCGCEIMGMILGDLPKLEPDENHPFAIKNIKGEVIATLGKNEACTEDLTTAYLDNLDLSHANLENADLHDAYIGFCNLTGANLRNADLSNAEIKCCEVAGADFSGADLSNAQIDITTDIWLDAITDDETIFPSHHRPSYM